MKKKVLAILLATAMTAAAAGCGNDASETGSTPGDSQESNAEEKNNEDGSAPAEDGSDESKTHDYGADMQQQMEDFLNPEEEESEEGSEE